MVLKTPCATRCDFSTETILGYNAFINLQAGADQSNICEKYGLPNFSPEEIEILSKPEGKNVNGLTVSGSTLL